MLALSQAAPARPRTAAPWFDGLSFLPEDMADSAHARLGGMICDVSEIREIRDANGTPRYLRDYETNASALAGVGARQDGRPDAFLSRQRTGMGGEQR